MARQELSEWQEKQVQHHQRVHEKMVTAVGGFAPTAVYYEGNGQALGQLVCTPQAGDDWMRALCSPLSLVERLTQLVVVVEVTAIGDDGADEMLVVVFARRGRLPLAVPVPFDRVGGEVVYGEATLVAGPLELAQTIEQAWAMQTIPDGWPSAPYEQFLLTLLALTEKGDVVGVPA